MGCDIHTFVEKRNKETNEWELVKDRIFTHEFHGLFSTVFDFRSYNMFDVLKYYIFKDDFCYNRGFPKNISKDTLNEYNEWLDCAYHECYLTVKELLDFNYDEIYNYSYKESFRENLNELFFINLEELKALGDPEDLRVVFFFDN